MKILLCIALVNILLDKSLVESYYPSTIPQYSESCWGIGGHTTECADDLVCDPTTYSCQCPNSRIHMTDNNCCPAHSKSFDTSTGKCIPGSGYSCDPTTDPDSCISGGLLCNSTTSTCACQIGTAWNDAEQICVPGPGYSCSSSNPCPSPTLMCSDNVCACAPVTTWSTTTTTCTCPTSTTWHSDGGSCRPTHQTYSTASQACICAPDFYGNAAKGTCCPKYTTWDSHTKTCVCALNANGNAADGTCSCNQDIPWNYNSNSCTCPQGTTWNTDDGICEKMACPYFPVQCTNGLTCINGACVCPHNYVSDPVTLTCVKARL